MAQKRKAAGEGSGANSTPLGTPNNVGQAPHSKYGSSQTYAATASGYPKGGYLQAPTSIPGPQAGASAISTYYPTNKNRFKQSG